jgi:hypothetical protein
VWRRDYGDKQKQFEALKVAMSFGAKKVENQSPTCSAGSTREKPEKYSR